MFFRLTTADSPPQSSRPIPSVHSPDHKGGLTFTKLCLKLKRHGTSESAESRDERTSQCSLPPLNGSPAPTLPTPPPSPQQTRAPLEGSTSSSSPQSPFTSAASSPQSSPTRSPKRKHHAEFSSGQIPLSHPGIAEHACPRRESIERLDTYHCTDGVNVPVLLRSTRTELIDIASILGANALVEEQWRCTIYGPRGRNKLMYKIQIHYKAQATRSTLADPHQPVALDQTRSIPGLMTVVRRNED